MDQFELLFLVVIVVVELEEPAGGVCEFQLDFFEFAHTDFFDVSFDFDEFLGGFGLALHALEEVADFFLEIGDLLDHELVDGADQGLLEGFAGF